MDRRNHYPGSDAPSDDHSNDTSAAQVIQQLFDETMLNDPHLDMDPMDLIELNMSRINAEMSYLINIGDDLGRGPGWRSRNGLSHLGSGSTSISNAESADIASLVAASVEAESRTRMELIRAARERQRRFIPSVDPSSEEDENAFRSRPAAGAGGGRRGWDGRDIPGPRRSSPSPPAHTMTSSSTGGPSSSWRQRSRSPLSPTSWRIRRRRHLQETPSPILDPVVPPTLSETPGYDGYQSWRRLRQLGHSARSFNLTNRLRQRFPSALCTELAPMSVSPLLRAVFPNLNHISGPERPERIQIGNRSFQPTAKFDNVPEAKPAKPEALGLLRCQEKAFAANFFQNIIGLRSDFRPGPIQLFPRMEGIEVFQRFWNDSNTIFEQPRENGEVGENGELGGNGETGENGDAAQNGEDGQNGEAGEIGGINDNQNEDGMITIPPPDEPISSSFSSTLNFPPPPPEDPDSAAEYLRWDAETRTSNHSRYSVWDALSRSHAVRTNANVGVAPPPRSTSSIGVGTDGDSGRGRLRFGRRHIYENHLEASSSSSSEDEDDMSSTSFMGETLRQETVSAMFHLDMPPIPSMASFSLGPGGDNDVMSRNQVPMPLSEPSFDMWQSRQYHPSTFDFDYDLELRRTGRYGDDRGDGVSNGEECGVDNDDVDVDVDDDEEYSSVFSTLFPDVDTTPSPLFRGLVDDTDWGQGSGTSCGIYDLPSYPYPTSGSGAGHTGTGRDRDGGCHQSGNCSWPRPCGRRRVSNTGVVQVEWETRGGGGRRPPQRHPYNAEDTHP